ncbi:phytoene/squalene synthase family protein [Coralloluteibacterium thermophilus]|uniref:Phytoene/squalene synthase family protein n=1 Tax=Coralloluteibacterium thermophilum TaxID=2707049 RepID=A0ABV9NM20_9GAMM
MSAAGEQAFAGFVAKWHAREPEMRVGEVFCPPPQRTVFRAWGALQHELREAVFELSDPNVAMAKSGWWAEELLALAQARPRHPVTQALAEAGGVPWAPLAGALIETVQVDARPAGREAAFADVQALAAALADAEAVLFGGAAADADARDAVATHLLAQRLLVGVGSEDRGRIPMHLQARHGLTGAQLAEEGGAPARRDWAGELIEALPARLPQAPLYRRLRAAADRGRLRRAAAGRADAPAHPLAALLRSWRAARAGAR